MTLVALRQSIADTLGEAIPVVEQSIPFSGEVNKAVVENYAMRSPCILVSVLGALDGSREAHQTSMDFRWGAFIITKDRAFGGRAYTRDDLSLAIAEAAYATLINNRWDDVPGARVATEIRGRNLWSPSMDEMGVTIWACTWRQGFELLPFDVSTLDDFLTFVGTFDKTPPDGLDTKEMRVTLDGPE